MHEQDWLIVIEALETYASPFDYSIEDNPLLGPRRALAMELAELFADHCDIPEGEIEDHIDEDWDGSER
ncbi:hypothetical protein [Natronococcus wangiae]|uniref:hypothetical protein n=1 Tax=Natronococcus wangiae TaxID=3068275 RepID=UPI00273FD36B|nr:hypothetical protein [Natronococcus sp. AD5]